MVSFLLLATLTSLDEHTSFLQRLHTTNPLFSVVQTPGPGGIFASKAGVSQIEGPPSEKRELEKVF
jgi:hypothetical protein